MLIQRAITVAQVDEGSIALQGNAVRQAWSSAAPRILVEFWSSFGITRRLRKPLY